MIEPEQLKINLCRSFCSDISVRAVPVGLAVSTLFSDSSGDRLGFFVIEGPDGLRIEDDGDYLSDLVALGVPIDTGTRGQLLSAILAEGNAYWDRDTWEIQTNSFPEDEISSRLISFISSLIRVRDLELLTRENVKSTFREDAISALKTVYGDQIEIDENSAIDDSYSEFPVDIIVRSRENFNNLGAIYLASSNDKLNEALLFKLELEQRYNKETKVFALIEEPDMRQISRRVFQRAQNRALSMPIFRGDENAAMAFVGRQIGLN